MRSGKSTRGFTLVEILIVVIILGILAAIVIPQFSNASNDARKSSLTSQLQAVRSQIQLYSLQHQDQYPPLLIAGGATGWDNMTIKTNDDHSTTGTPLRGPYLQSPPTNSMNNNSSVGIVSGATDYGSGGAANASGSVGWVFNTTTGKIWATSRLYGFIYNEGRAGDPNNEL